jgi:hypothetical protein
MRRQLHCPQVVRRLLACHPSVQVCSRRNLLACVLASLILSQWSLTSSSCSSCFLGAWFFAGEGLGDSKFATLGLAPKTKWQAVVVSQLETQPSVDNLVRNRSDPLRVTAAESPAIAALTELRTAGGPVLTEGHCSLRTSDKYHSDGIQHCHPRGLQRDMPRDLQHDIQQNHRQQHVGHSQPTSNLQAHPVRQAQSSPPTVSTYRAQKTDSVQNQQTGPNSRIDPFYCDEDVGEPVPH